MRWYLALVSLVLALLLAVNVPLYAGFSRDSGLSVRMEHGRLTVRRDEATSSKPFWIDFNTEGLRWAPEVLAVDAHNWEVTLPVWLALAPALLAAGWAWSRRDPVPAG